MKVQSIQTNQTTNNCRKPCFKAYFVNDVDGIYRRLWVNAAQDEALEQKIKNFTNKHINHKLEILSEKDGMGRVNPNTDTDNVYGTAYKIFNHYTGKLTNYFISASSNATLFNLLDCLEKDNKIFRDDSKARVYRFLTGQERPKAVEISTKHRK